MLKTLLIKRRLKLKLQTQKYKSTHINKEKTMYGKSKSKKPSKALKGGQKRLPAALKSKIMKSKKRK